MEIGNKVLYYTHEANGPDDHRTKDYLAFVLAEPAEGVLDVVYFPPGGPVMFARVTQFDADNPYTNVGGSYWRAEGEDPPDFGQHFAYTDDSRWTQMLNEHRKEYVETDGLNQSKVRERHKRQRDELETKLKSERNAE